MSNFPVMQQALAVVNEVQTMSSREIAELTGKQHNSVMRDIRNMLEQLEQSTDLYSGQYTANGRSYNEYNLPRRECEILVTGYDVRRRAAVIDRWMELESTPRTSNSLLNALVTTQQQVDALVIVQDQQSARIGEILESQEVLQDALRGIECPPGHASVGDIKRSYAPWMSELKIRSVMDSLDWPFTYFTVPIHGGFNRECRGYVIDWGDQDIRSTFQQIRREARQISNCYYVHGLVTGKFQIN